MTFLKKSKAKNVGFICHKAKTIHQHIFGVIHIHIHIQVAALFNYQIGKLQIHHFSTFQTKRKPESHSKEVTATYK